MNFARHRDSELEAEGVTRYRLEWRRSKALSSSLMRDMNGWRSLFFRLRWIGQDPKRYGGLGFGNVSRWMEEKNDHIRFLVSGSQTGKLFALRARHYALVTECFPEGNRVVAMGPCAPSSESMTHAMVYRCERSARYVFHVHAPALWVNARRLGLPVTRRDALYGTPAMAAEVARLFRVGSVRRTGIFAMAGHLDGMMSFGRTAEQAAERLLCAAARLFGQGWVREREI